MNTSVKCKAVDALKAAAVVEEGVIPGGVEVERVTEKVSGEADGKAKHSGASLQRAAA